MRSTNVKAILFIVMLANIIGCEKPVYFPAESLPEAAAKHKAFAAYDSHNTGKADFYLFADANGHVNSIAYADANSAAPGAPVNLNSISFKDCRHLVIILDGFGYDVVKAFYDAGHFRMFYAPSRVIAPYPTLTDLAIEDALGHVPCRGLEAMYFNRKNNRVEGGSSDYLDGKNEPYNDLLQYRAASLWDALGYIYPWEVYGKEINDIKRTFDKIPNRELLAYSVSSAGMGTRMGAEGQTRALVRAEQLVNQVIMETRGKVKITMLADHGHSYTPGERVTLEKHLEGKGWNLVESLNKPKDAVYIRFGLETYAAFSTNQPAELAADLVTHPGVTLASYAEKQAVMVLGRPVDANSPSSAALVYQKGGRYKYEPIHGDPIDMKPILAALKPDAEGYYDETELFDTTYMHQWPDPLQRLWRAHNGIVDNPADVIVSLEDKYFSGSTSFGGSITVASTHGSLNRRNSTTFIMSTIGPLPPYMRSADIPRNMEKLTGSKFPARN